MENVIEIKNVHKSFEGFQLKDLTLTVKKDLSQVLSEEMV